MNTTKEALQDFPKLKETKVLIVILKQIKLILKMFTIRLIELRTQKNMTH